MDLERIAEQVAETAITTGQYAYRENQRFTAAQIDFKDFNNLVSYVDKEAEKYIVESLRKVLPQAGFVTEEETATEKGEEYNWIIDPIDGTTNFTHHLPTYAVSIALEYKGKLVIGVVYEPNQRECFTAVKGKGAYLNGEKISVNPVSRLRDAMIATGFPYDIEGKIDDMMALLKYFVLNTRGVRRFGAASVDLCYVACGRFAGYYEFNLHPWDVAAGGLIVQEAGGEVVDFKGKNNWQDGKEIIAGGPVVKELLASINKMWFY